MIVSIDGKTFVRCAHECQIRRNGSMIDIYFERGGQRLWIGIAREDLQRALEIVKQGESIIGAVEYDEETAEG